MQVMTVLPEWKENLKRQGLIIEGQSPNSLNLGGIG